MFGSGSTTQSFGGFNLGQTSTTTTNSGFSFGQTSTLGAGGGGGLSLGQPAASSGGFFSQPAAAATTAGGFSFPQPAASSAAGGFSFGQPAASTATTSTASAGGFSFGQTPATTTAAATGFGGFGQTSGGSGFSLGAVSSSTPSLSLGGQTTTSSTPGFGGLFSTTNTTAQTSGTNTLAGGLNFGLSSTSTGLSLGGTTTATTNTGFSLLGTSTALPTATATQPTFGLGGTAPISSTTPSLGLGGAQPPTATGLNTTGLQPDGKSTKETPLPQEIYLTIDMFENYKSTEKAASESNIRQTAAPFHKLGDDTVKLKQHILQLSNKHSQIQASTNKLKSRVMENVENVKMARRTQETPMSQQGDNKAPEQYFLQLVRSFEDRMRYCRTKIEQVENCNRANNGQSGVSAEDIKDVLKREHETLKIVAAKVYSLHNTLLEKCQQLNTSPETRPDSFFKPRNSEISSSERTPAPSSVLRPLLGEGGSGLLNFQAGQQKAKAMLIGAPPPTLPLGTSNPPPLFGSMNQTGGLFNTTSNTSMWGTPNNNNNNNNSFKFNTTGFGSPSLNNSTFGSPLNNTTALSFGNTTNTNLNQNTLFGSPAVKSFKL